MKDPVAGGDFGGCRCQAFALTGDLEATDPVCCLSPHHHVMAEIAGASMAAEPSPAFTAALITLKAVHMRTRIWHVGFPLLSAASVCVIAQARKLLKLMTIRLSST
jgi:hypothetical protein